MRKRLIAILVILIVLVGFVALNIDQRITVSFGLFDIPQAPLLILLAIAFLLGFGAAIYVARAPRSSQPKPSSSPQNDTPKQ